MGKKHATAHVSDTATPDEPKIYEVREFANIHPGKAYVQMRHYRTVYHADGRITREDVSSIDAALE